LPHEKGRRNGQFAGAQNAGLWRVREIVRTNDEVLLGFLQCLLEEAGIASIVLDRNMSALEGSVGMLPRRLLVEDDSYAQACRVMRDADLGQWIVRP
jgi:hypothetical protein